MQFKQGIRRGVALLVVSVASLAAGATNATSLNNELWELTGGVTRNVYVCNACTEQQFFDVPLPGPNWERNASAGNSRLFLPDFGTNERPIVPEGTDLSLDLVPEIEGDDHFLIARVRSATLLGAGAQGFMARVRVARGTTMTWLPGRVVHKVTDTLGVDYVLFSMSEIHTATFDPTVLNGLAGMSLPFGWSYSSEVLTAPLVVGTPSGVATVFSAVDHWTWQRVIIVPEPSTATLLGVGLLGLSRRRSA